ncbi:hypothetical protein SDC9_147138 [bioreactor metagenome]|uniref:Uncharacterized protein n=1 Tax=bioreactor metagenome TaxID=1076179 RepID=A0A645EGR1_9ZZZZ
MQQIFINGVLGPNGPGGNLFQLRPGAVGGGDGLHRGDLLAVIGHRGTHGVEREKQNDQRHRAGGCQKRQGLKLLTLKFCADQAKSSCNLLPPAPLALC